MVVVPMDGVNGGGWSKMGAGHKQCAFGVNGRFVVTVGVNSWSLL
jgi:hypothetical protein